MKQHPRTPHEFLSFLAYLAWLTTYRRLSRPPLSTTDRVLICLITSVGIVLGILALVTVGTPEQVSEFLKNWPVLP
jgi:hypothetical protein